MATRSETIGIGVAVEESQIRVVEVAIGASSSAVRRFVSLPWRETGLARSILRAVDALDSKKTVPVGITCGPLSEADQLKLLSAIGPSRTVRIYQPEAAIAHLNLAPNTHVGSVTQLDGWSVPPQLFESHPDLEFSDLLGAIGAVLAMSDRPGGSTVAPAKQHEPRSALTVKAPAPSPGAPSPQPASVDPFGASPTPPPAPSPLRAAPSPPAKPDAGTQSDQPTRINLPKPGSTPRPDQKSPSHQPSERPRAATKPTATANQRSSEPTHITLAKPSPKQQRTANAEFDKSELTIAPSLLGLAKTDAIPGSGRGRKQSFEVPLVTLAADESADHPTARRRGRLLRRPLPLALAVVVVLVGLGIALGVVLGDGGSVVDQKVTALILRPHALA